MRDIFTHGYIKLNQIGNKKHFINTNGNYILLLVKKIVVHIYHIFKFCQEKSIKIQGKGINHV